MSKEDQTCKMSSGCKHKERKPKKPHYIPRPWGKPYNYKCFQCPFTCMEKSHLYNHMKYSLCKNSLSLLIESDWPYKKGNMLHPEQLRSLQAGSRRGREDGDEQISAQKSEICFTPDELDETEDNGDLESGQKEIAEENCTTKESREHTDSSSRATIKTSKSSETDFVVTDVLSLEDQLLRARSIEVEAKLRHYKLSKTCLTGSNLLSEQWGLLATSHRKGKSEGMTPNSSIPCYPPPATFSDSPEASALNLSLLGVSYPLSPSLFSYINPAVPSASPPHPHMGQLPFLTSTAQFMHPVSNTVPHADRSLLPPRFYYPLLCEHTFGATQGDTSKPVKSGQSSTSILDTNNSPNLSSKINLWKVPALRPSPAAAWPVHEHVPSVVPEAGHREAEEKFHNGSKDCKGWSLKSTMDGPLGREHASKRTGAPLERHEQPIEKKTTPVSTVDLLKNIHFNSNLSMPPDMFLNASSFRPTHHYSRVLDEWSANLKKGFPETLYDSLKPERIVIQQEEHDAESAAVLLADLTKALQEYQEAERKITHLPKEDHPGQRHLWQHLCKIRSELSHIHLALEKTAQQNEGPLDLSLKKDLPVISNRESQSMDRLLKESVIGETEEEEELEEEDGVEMVEKTLQNQNHSIGVFVKINQAGLTETSLGGMVKTEVLSPGGLGIRANSVEALWPSRTTKCEADSSVLLSPDGRPLVFTDFNPGAVNMKRPSSSETACPLSPLTSNDS